MFRVVLKIRIFKRVSAHRVDAHEIFIEMQKFPRMSPKWKVSWFSIRQVFCFPQEWWWRVSALHYSWSVKPWRALGTQGVCIVNRAVGLLVLRSHSRVPRSFQSGSSILVYSECNLALDAMALVSDWKCHLNSELCLLVYFLSRSSLHTCVSMCSSS